MKHRLILVIACFQYQLVVAITAMEIQGPAAPFGFTCEPKYSYDVFLSFRGEDTRLTFTGSLYDALRRKGINTFLDDKKLGKGKRISPTLLRAIEKSRISIIVFSKNYATSTWCLDELAHILLCRKEKNQLVMPIFYKVEPSDIQHQRNSFGEAMAAHEGRFRNDMEKVHEWRSALSEAASLSGWLFESGYEYGFIERIVEEVYAKLPPKRLHITEHMVGLESRIEEVKSFLDIEPNNSVCMLGIHGTGGIGKTTLAKALYHSIFHQFQGASFLFDVREVSKQYRGIVRLQQTLLSEILEEKKMKLGSVDEGISKIKHRLGNKKVLLVLDDVDEVEQLENLAGGCDWFGSGSRIIITTRNKQLLIASHVDKTYQMMKLSDHDSLELLCWHAFRMSQPPTSYEDMSDRVISYAQGLPLALKVIGSNLIHKSLEEWKFALEQYERIPERTIQDVLKISYNCLQDNAKSIFLDIACFFKKRRLQYVEEILDASDFGARFYIEVLVDKSLITINEFGCLWMHDLIQEMGREIVRQEAPLNPGERSRLWHHEDILRVLRENSGCSNIQGIMLDAPQQQEVEWSGIAFEKMNNLRILIVRNAHFSTGPKHFPNNLRLLDWDGYPSMSLPLDFYPEKLVVFRLCRSLVRLEEPFKRFEYVTNMYFSHCEFITEVPDMSQVPNLRELIFKDCCNLIKIHDSVGSLSKLVQLDVSGCTKLRTFPREIKLAALEFLDFTDCKTLDYFPNIIGKMDALRIIHAENTAIKELPHSIGNLLGLQLLDMNTCKSLKELPDSLFMLQNLCWLLLGDSRPRSRKSFKKSMQESHSTVISCANLEFLNLENCRLLDEDLHLTLNCFRNLQALYLSGNDFVSLPECIKESANLLELDVTNCKRLRDIPEIPTKLKIIKAENCTSLTTESSGRLWSQARKEVRDLLIKMPETAIPDWFNYCCKGGTLSFSARGKFPVVALAFELGKSNVRSRCEGELEIHIEPRVFINGRKVERKGSPTYLHSPVIEGNLLLWDLRQIFGEAEWHGLDKLLAWDWNEVEIQAICDSPDLPIVNCGVYLYKQQTNMENVQLKSSPYPNNSTMLSMNAPRTLLKRRAIASPPHEPTKKLLRKFKATDKGKENTKTKKRRSQHQKLPCDRIRKTGFPMGTKISQLFLTGYFGSLQKSLCLCVRSYAQKRVELKKLAY